jgi:hypothetical protein
MTTTISTSASIVPERISLRDYTKIYTGTNQKNGYEKPFLSFITDTAEIRFKKDKSTYFHYPETAPSLHISVVEDLISLGAFAGSSPSRADRIFKKQADYKNNTPWGESTQVNCQRGTWLCSWLSGNSDDPQQTPVWMDRWYYPGSLDTSHTIFTQHTSAAYDIPSEMTFDPGVWYRYDHIGDDTNFQIIENLSGLQIHIDNWDEISIDESGNGNFATLYNYTSSEAINEMDSVYKIGDEGLELNGINQYASILYSPAFNAPNNISYNVWVQMDNWQETYSHHIISNGLRGGCSLGINTGFFTPFSVSIDQSGNMIFVNQLGSIYKDIVLPGLSNPISYTIDSELYTWVLDNGVYQGFKHLYKIDYNGNVDNVVYFSSATNLYDLTIDQYDNLWVLGTNNVSAFNTYCQIISSAPIIGNRLVINSNNELSAFNAIDSCVFDNQYYFTIDSAGDIYLNNQLLNNSLSATNIRPTKDNVWILNKFNQIIKLEKNIDILTDAVTFIPVLSTTILDDNITEENQNIFFTNERITDSECEDFVWVLCPSTGYLYKYDTSLTLIKKINITYIKNSIQSAAVKGDAAGYNRNLLFNYNKLKAPNTPQIEASVYLGTGSPLLTGKLYKSILPVSGLSVNDWHMFTSIIEDGAVKFYVDAVLRDTISIPISSSVFYKYETPLLIGSNIGQINNFDSEINSPNKFYHSGKIDDLRMYNLPLNTSDIRHLYLAKYTFKDLIWNIPTSSQTFIEEIDKFFKFKLPGQKSQYYNIHLKGLQITDANTREIIEDIIKNTIQKITPLYTSLYKIIWD